MEEVQTSGSEGIEEVGHGGETSKYPTPIRAHRIFKEKRTLVNNLSQIDFLIIFLLILYTHKIFL